MQLRFGFATLSIALMLLALTANNFAQNVYLNGKSIGKMSTSYENIPSIRSSKVLKQQSSAADLKLSSDLLQLVKPAARPQALSLDNHLQTMTSLKQFRSNSPAAGAAAQLASAEVYVYVFMNNGAATSVVDEFAVGEVSRSENFGLAVAWIPLKDLEKLAENESVRLIRSVQPPVTYTGSVNSEGDGHTESDIVRSLYNSDGSGMTIGVLSDGVDNRASAQASNDLPPDGAALNVLDNSVGGDEGTAILEILHDLAPGANMVFHTAGNNTVEFNSALDDLVAAGCNIIMDDIGWITQPFFEHGFVASHFETVLAANNILYFSSAGNAGQSHYQSDYSPIAIDNVQHNFGNIKNQGFYLYVQMAIGGNARVILEWNDEFGASANDYDMGFWSFTDAAYVQVSTATQDGTQDPLEFINYNATNLALQDFAVIVEPFNNPAVRTLEVYIYTAGNAANYINNIDSSDAIFGHAAVDDAIAMAAVNAADLQAGSEDVAGYSSQGPVTHSFPVAQTINKPDLTSVDGVSVTGAGGFPSPFFGTSAAAPHASAVAALIWGQLPGSTNVEIRDMMFNAAEDFGDPGFDFTYGFGFTNTRDIFNQNVPILSDLAAMLAGPFDDVAGEMETYLADNGMVPLNQPYGGAPWNYGGTESVASLPDDVVDWVLVKLRTGISAASEVAVRAAFITKTGAVVDLDGVSPVEFKGVEPGDYHVVLCHRSHLAIMTANPEPLEANGATPYDFTTAQSTAYTSGGVNSDPMIDAGGGVFAAVPGDGNGDGGIDASDRNIVWRPQNGTVWQYTKGGDFNMDGGIDVLDLNLNWRPNSGKGTQVPQ